MERMTAEGGGGLGQANRGDGIVFLLIVTP